jgi:nicotinate (nicotinamide) nucleotide adenylyltransferase
VALQFLRRASTGADRVAVFPGAWNPPTVAHVEIARAALNHAGEIVWVLPRAFPHKKFDAAGFAARCRMLELVTELDPHFSAAVSDGGLYAEIAEEARDAFGDGVEVALVCGRDAAERIESWNYGIPDFHDQMLERYPLIVAARAGDYEAPERHRNRISRLALGEDYNDISSSEIRRRIDAGEAWRHLVPALIADLVETLYSPLD